MAQYTICYLVRKLNWHNLELFTHQVVVISFQFTHKKIISSNYCCCIYYIISPPMIYIRLLRLLYHRLSAECPSQTLEKNKVFIISTWPCMATMDRCLFYEILWINPPTPLQTIIFTKIIPLSIFYAQGVLGSVRAVWSHRPPKFGPPSKYEVYIPYV